jgi:hypothetical protein
MSKMGHADPIVREAQERFQGQPYLISTNKKGCIAAKDVDPDCRDFSIMDIKDQAVFIVWEKETRPWVEHDPWKGLSDALHEVCMRMGIKATAIALPFDCTLAVLNEDDMRKAGWVRESKMDSGVRRAEEKMRELARKQAGGGF